MTKPNRQFNIMRLLVPLYEYRNHIREELTEAVKERDLAKADVDRIEAQLDNHLKSKPTQRQGRRG